MQQFLKLRSRYPNARLACTALLIGLASLSTMTVRASAQTFGTASVPLIVTDIAKQPLMVQVDHLLQALSFGRSLTAIGTLFMRRPNFRTIEPW
jgi:hypothetical protein